MAEYQVLFEPDSENADTVILSSLLHPAAYLNSIVSNFITLHITYVHWIFKEGALFLDGGVVWKEDKLKALLKLAALQGTKFKRETV